MIDFQPFDIHNKSAYDQFLQNSGERGCEYSFVNLYLWGRQRAAFLKDHLVFFSQFDRKSVYPFPVGTDDKKPVLDAIIQDAKERGIPCRLTGLTQDDCALLEKLYPGKLRYHFDRNSFDYVYDINDLADLKGKKFQKKRNHLNRFRAENPDHLLQPITRENIHLVENLVMKWYDLRRQSDPHADFHMEQAALKKALTQYDLLGLEGLVLYVAGEPVAMTIGSRLNPNTFDVHFEKALDIADGAYPAINNGFARYLREKYPDVQFLNREDDMGLEGLRKAKLSYNPHHMVEKSWAHLLEDGYDY
ncbi:MAG: DUF2156 domain-containing protein [Oscillospiraceae bacterium]|nr:DUF2156 domain-containing protein [Oscillospiraceae bacterium]